MAPPPDPFRRFDDRFWRATARWSGPALGALATALYLIALPNDWVLDDRLFILSNPFVRDLHRLPSIFWTDYWSFFTQAGVYRPVTVLALALQHAVAGDAGWSYRIGNALLHGATTSLLFSVLHGGLRLPRPASVLGAALFAVHPACSETVLLVVGRADMFVALAALGMMRLHLAEYHLGGYGPRTLVPAALALLLLGLASKETAVAIPPLLVAVDLVRGRLTRFATLHAMTFGLMLSFWYGVRAPVLGLVHDEPALLENPLREMSLPARLPAVLGALGRYVALLAAPVHLSVDYSFDAIAVRPALSDPHLVLGAASVALSLAAYLRAWRTGNVALGLAVAIVWLPLVPVSNVLLPILTIFAERFLYLPAAGLAVLVAEAVARRPRLAPAVAALALILLARTAVRERDWRDELTLYARTARDSRSAKAHYFYGLALDAAARPAEAEVEYRRATEIWPGYYQAHMDLAGVLLKQKRATEAEAALRGAITAGAREATPHVMLGQLYFGSARYAAAAAAFAGATAIEPDGHAGWYGRGATLFRLGDTRRARLALRKALKRKPGDPVTRLALARVALYGDGDATQAVALLEPVVRETPKLAPAWADLGEAYARLGRDGDARDTLRQAVILAPDNPAYRDRLAALGDGTR